MKWNKLTKTRILSAAMALTLAASLGQPAVVFAEEVISSSSYRSESTVETDDASADSSSAADHTAKAADDSGTETASDDADTASDSTETDNGETPTSDGSGSASEDNGAERPEDTGASESGTVDNAADHTNTTGAASGTAGDSNSAAENSGSASDKSASDIALKTEDSDQKADAASSDEKQEKAENEKDEEETEIEAENLDDASKEAQEENEEKPEQTNEQLIAQQNIVHVPTITSGFRFYLVDRTYAFARADGSVYADTDTAAETVGSLHEGNVLFVLEEISDDWLYVESGPVRGYVPAELLCQGDEADQMIAAYAAQAEEEADSDADDAEAASESETDTEEASEESTEEDKDTEESTEETDAAALLVQKAQPYFTYARMTVSIRENKAYFDTLATTYDKVIEKKYALVNTDGVNIREEKNTDSRIVGTMNKDTLAYIIADEGKDWVYIESGDVRGFVSGDYLTSGEETDARIESEGEDSFASAREKISYEDSEATYYTLTSVKEGTKVNPLRQQIINKAAEYIGNPYVWGGTSLTNGADCSGFVQSLYALFGISLPRVAEAQAVYGTQIPVSDAAPGDLIFFAKDGYVYHVALYIGDDLDIEAYGTAVGIIYNHVDTAHAVWATRVIQD